MEGPTSSTTAELYILAHEQTAISTVLQLQPPKVWERFVDDIYFILKRTDLNRIKTLSLLWRN